MYSIYIQFLYPSHFELPHISCFVLWWLECFSSWQHWSLPPVKCHWTINLDSLELIWMIKSLWIAIYVTLQAYVQKHSILPEYKSNEEKYSLLIRLTANLKKGPCVESTISAHNTMFFFLTINTFQQLCTCTTNLFTVNVIKTET